MWFPHSTLRSKALTLTCKSKVHRYSSQKPEDIVKSKRQESEKKTKTKNRTKEKLPIQVNKTLKDEVSHLSLITL